MGLIDKEVGGGPLDCEKQSSAEAAWQSLGAKIELSRIFGRDAEPRNHKGRISDREYVSLNAMTKERGLTAVESGGTGSARADESTAAREPPRASFVLKAWLPEILWCGLSIGFLVALVVVLSHFDDHPMPQWPLGLTVNTLVAFLATSCRAMVVVPLSEGLAQLKWNWFASRRRSLRDIYFFDQASRGPWGDLCLIPRTLGSYMLHGAIAAFVLVSGGATSFVTQSTISYQSKAIIQPSSSALAPAARSFPDALQESGIDDQDVVEGMTRAANKAAFYTVNETYVQPTASCPFSYCTWEQYPSLGLCASQGNVTQHLVISEIDNPSGETPTINASLPEGLAYLEFPDEFRVMVNVSAPNTFKSGPFDSGSASPRITTLANWSDIDVPATAVSQLFLIYTNANPDPQFRFRAIELLWHFCVNTYDIEVKDGRTETKVRSSATKMAMVTNGTTDESERSYYTLKSEEGNGSFKVTNSNILPMLQNDFGAGFSGDWSSDSGGEKSFTFAYQFGYNLYSGIGPATSDEELDTRTWSNLEVYTGIIAYSVTAYLRQSDGGGAISGQGSNYESFILVRWEWLSLLAGQVGLTAIFLISVIIHTARLGVDVVKSANTAELFALGHHGEPGIATPGQNRVDGIRTQVDRATMARLRRSEAGWRLQTE